MTGASEPGRSPALTSESQRRRLLEQSLTTRFGLRMHMSLMLAAAFSVGFMSNFIMLRHAFVPLPWRWVIAYCIGYAVLFIALRLWLAYVGVRPLTRSAGGSSLDAADAFNGPIYWPSGGGRGGGSGGGGGSRGGGGSYGGAGASGNFDGAALAGGSPGSAHGGTQGGIGGLFDGDDAGKLLVLIAVVALILAAFGGGIVFLIVSAPHLLVDMAFGAAITGGIVPATKRAAVEPQWEGSVWRATWKPAVAMLLVLVVCALALHHYFPGVQTLGQAFASLR